MAARSCHGGGGCELLFASKPDDFDTAPGCGREDLLAADPGRKHVASRFFRVSERTGDWKMSLAFLAEVPRILTWWPCNVGFGCSDSFQLH